MSQFSLRMFLTYSRSALDFIAFAPVLLVFLAAGASLFVAAIKQSPFQRKLWRPYHWLVLTQLLFFPAAIMIGVIWYVQLPNGHPSQHALIVRDVLWYASLVSGAFWIWRFKGFRWYGVSLV